jgi:DNA-binding transcriptional MocR family regulator
MIEMQYNFPLLPTQGLDWQLRLRRAVDTLHPADPSELRPTFRSHNTTHRALAAAWLGSTPETTWITAGGHHGTLLSMLAANLAGRNIAFDRISYTGGLEQARMLAAHPIPIDYDAEGTLPASLAEACERARTSATGPIAALYTMPTVHNPLGCTASLARRHAIVAIARAHDLLLIEDNAYGYMEPDAPPSYAQLAPERTFFVRGLSKSFAPAAQTGFLLAPPRFAPAIDTALKNTTTGTSLVNNIAALSLLADGTIDTLMAAKREEGARRNAAARAVLGPSAAPGSPCAWHLWLHLPPTLDAPTAEHLCHNAGVLVSGGNWFATDPTNPPAALRLGLGGELDPARTQQGCEIVAKVLATHS